MLKKIRDKIKLPFTKKREENPKIVVSLEAVKETSERERAVFEDGIIEKERKRKMEELSNYIARSVERGMENVLSKYIGAFEKILEEREVTLRESIYGVGRNLNEIKDGIKGVSNDIENLNERVSQLEEINVSVDKNMEIIKNILFKKDIKEEGLGTQENEEKLTGEVKPVKEVIEETPEAKVLEEVKPKEGPEDAQSFENVEEIEEVDVEVVEENEEIGQVSSIEDEDIDTKQAEELEEKGEIVSKEKIQANPEMLVDFWLVYNSISFLRLYNFIKKRTNFIFEEKGKEFIEENSKYFSSNAWDIVRKTFNTSISPEAVQYYYSRSIGQSSFKKSLFDRILGDRKLSLYFIYAFLNTEFRAETSEKELYTGRSSGVYVKNIDKLGNLFFLLSFLWFLLERYLLGSKSYSYSSVSMEGEGVKDEVVDERFFIYKNIPLGNHSFNLAALSLEEIYRLRKAGKDLGFFSIVEVLLGSMLHDIGKAYNAVNEHDSKDILDKVLEDYYIYMNENPEKTENFFPFDFNFESGRTNDFFLFKVGKESFLETVKDRVKFDEFKKNKIFRFYSNIIRFHHSPIKDDELPVEERLLFKIISRGDKLTRILENRMYIFLKDNLNKTSKGKYDFIGLYSSMSSLVEKDSPFDLYKMSKYSEFMNGNSRRIEDINGLNDEGVKLFSFDFKTFVKRLCKSVDEVSYFAREYKCFFSETRNSYVFPYFVLENELLSLGWGDIFQRYTRELNENSFSLFKKEFLVETLKKGLDGDHEIKNLLNKGLLFETKDNKTYMVYLSKELADRLIGN